MLSDSALNVGMKSWSGNEKRRRPAFTYIYVEIDIMNFSKPPATIEGSLAVWNGVVFIANNEFNHAHANNNVCWRFCFAFYCDCAYIKVG